MKNLLLALVVSMSAVLLAACGPTQDGCQKDTDCTQGRLCTAGECATPFGVGGPGGTGGGTASGGGLGGGGAGGSGGGVATGGGGGSASLYATCCLNSDVYLCANKAAFDKCTRRRDITTSALERSSAQRVFRGPRVAAGAVTAFICSVTAV